MDLKPCLREVPFGKETVQEEDGELVSRISVAPQSLACECCDLRLEGVAELEIFGLSGHYTRRTTYEPGEYYGMIHPDEIDMEELARDYLENRENMTMSRGLLTSRHIGAACAARWP